MTSGDYPICTCGRTTSGGASGCPLHDTLRRVPLGDTIGTSQLYVPPNNALPEHLQTQAEKDDARIADLETKLAAAEERVRELEEDRSMLLEATIHGVTLDTLFPEGGWPDGADEYLTRLAQWMVENEVDDGTLNANKAIARLTGEQGPLVEASDD